MTKMRLLASVLGATLALLPPVARGQATPNDIELLTHDSGWALLAGRLFWTANFGHDWRDITPPGVTPNGLVTIAGVFFLDTSNGWALLRHAPSRGYAGWSFDLTSTQDAGRTWAVSPVTLPNWPRGEDLGGGGALGFVDSTHGWVDLSLVGSTNFAPGVLYSTTDGGRTWEPVPTAPMIAALVRFVTMKDGWLAGGPAGQDLYATHDGGKSWQRISLKAPPQAGRAVLPTYQLPVFRGPEHGRVPVFYSGGKGDGSAVVLFASSDGGEIWRPVGSLTSPLDSSQGGLTPWAVTDSGLVTAGPGRVGLTVRGFRSDGRLRTDLAPIPAGSASIARLSFADSQHGWALVTGGSGPQATRWRLYSTGDSGAAWAEITPELRGATPARGTLKQPHEAAVPLEGSLGPGATTGFAAAGHGGGGGESSAGAGARQPRQAEEISGPKKGNACGLRLYN